MQFAFTTKSIFSVSVGLKRSERKKTPELGFHSFRLRKAWTGGSKLRDQIKRALLLEKKKQNKQTTECISFHRVHQNLNTLRSISVTLWQVARLSACSNGKTCRHGVSSLEYKQNVQFARSISQWNIYRDPFFSLFPRSLCFPMATDSFCSPPHLRPLVHTSPAGVSTSLERKRDKISRRRTARARSTRSPPERLSGQKQQNRKDNDSVSISCCAPTKRVTR